MTAPTAAKPAPSWAARNAKFLWAAAALVLTVATDVANSFASFIPGAWLAPLHAVILGLTAVGVQRDTNAVGVAEVVSLVQHILPGHTLTPLPAAETVLKTVETAAASAAPYVPSAAILAQVGSTPAAPVAEVAPTAPAA